MACICAACAWLNRTVPCLPGSAPAYLFAGAMPRIRIPLALLGQFGCLLGRHIPPCRRAAAGAASTHQVSRHAPGRLVSCGWTVMGWQRSNRSPTAGRQGGDRGGGAREPQAGGGSRGRGAGAGRAAEHPDYDCVMPRAHRGVVRALGLRSRPSTGCRSASRRPVACWMRWQDHKEQLGP